MSSYLSIYLQKKKKEGEEQEERLLLCSIPRSNHLYQEFYDNNVGFVVEDDFHEFTASNLNDRIADTEQMILATMGDVMKKKETVPLISNKEALEEVLENLDASKDWLVHLIEQKAGLDMLYDLISDVGEEWCDFDKIYWRID